MERKINIDAAKELVKLYRSITYEQVQSHISLLQINYPALSEDNCIQIVILQLTGFGTSSCLLCVSADKLRLEDLNGSVNKCHHCIYCNNNNLVTYTFCKYDYYNTYESIENAKSIEELITAINKRANLIESLIKKLENDGKIE
jgi:hypothetical protein